MKSKLEDEIDALFTLPLAEFTSVRNTLASRLKKEKRTDEAERVKLLSKPPVSAWAVNQLYWNHRDEFEQLIATGKRFHSAQASRSAAKVANMRDSLEARRQSLVDLSGLATELLQDAGHNPSQDTLHRITTTLEALSAYALLPDGPNPGRLTQDVDPPSFELLASLISGEATAAPVSRARASSSTKSKTPAIDTRRIRQAKIAEAKLLLQEAKKALADARAKAQSAEAAQKKATADAKETDKYKRAAEERLQRATAVAEAAARRAQTAAEEATEAAQTLDDAKRAVEAATKELESLLQS
jgi:DNA repair exonuclease SbcCD ATPase subunit